MSDLIKQLRTRLVDEQEFKWAFQEAFALARKQGIPQFAEYKINTLDDYINFYDQMLSWSPRENNTADNIYNHLCMFYFVIDQPPVKFFQSAIKPWSGWKWLSQWLVDYSNELGKFMDTPQSLTEETLKTFYEPGAYKAYHMQDYTPPTGGWKTFNEFFARHIHPSARPITQPNNDLVIVNPADCHFDGQWPVNDTAETSFTSKGVPWSISQLLQDTSYGEKFKGGKFMHSFLAPTDYHRQHAPVAGIVREAKVIPGLCYLEVVSTADAETGKPKMYMHRKLDAPDDPGYQFLQARGLIVIDNPVVGLVAVLPIGMCQISSVVLSVKEGDKLQKGQEVSYFQFGGSDIVVVFEARANVDIVAKDWQPFGSHLATAQVPQQ